MNLCIDLFSGVTLQNVLKENSIEISDESFFGLKYDPEAVWGYIEVLQSRLIILWEFSYYHK